MFKMKFINIKCTSLIYLLNNRCSLNLIINRCLTFKIVKWVRALTLMQEQWVKTSIGMQLLMLNNKFRLNFKNKDKEQNLLLMNSLIIQVHQKENSTNLSLRITKTHTLITNTNINQLVRNKWPSNHQSTNNHNPLTITKMLKINNP